MFLPNFYEELEKGMGIAAGYGNKKTNNLLFFYLVAFVLKTRCLLISIYKK